MKEFDFLDEIPISMIILNAEYKIIHWNRHLEQWSKISKQEVINNNLFERFENLNKPSYKIRLKNIILGGPPTSFSSLLHKYFIPIEVSEGAFASQSCTAKHYRVEATGHSYIILSIQDMTEIDKRNKQIKKVQLDLTTKLKKSNDYLDEFTGIVAHDLKAPLRGIRNYIKFMFEDFDNELQPEAREHLNRINFLANSMDGLIKNMYEFSRLANLDLNDSKVDIGELLETVTAPLLLIGTKNNIKFHVAEELPVICCDQVRIGEVFHNLIVNAIRYNSKPLKEVTIKYQIKDDKVIFTVKDNGDGIEERHFKKIFRLFSRLSLEDGESTGVGLSFVKQILERSGGEVWLDSLVGVGTSFYFSLPHKST